MYVFHYGNRTVQSHWFAILLTRASSMFAITLCNRTGLLCCFACIYVIYFATDASTGLNFLRWCVCLLRFVDRSSLSFGARVTCLSSATHRPGVRPLLLRDISSARVRGVWRACGTLCLLNTPYSNTLSLRSLVKRTSQYGVRDRNRYHLSTLKHG
jgi:hypothetical protein